MILDVLIAEGIVKLYRIYKLIQAGACLEILSLRRAKNITKRIYQPTGCPI